MCDGVASALARGRQALGSGQARDAALLAAAVVVVLVLPLLLSPFWVQTGVFALVAAIGAIGLNLLMGSAGVFWVAPSFFFAVGSYSYAVLAVPPAHLLGQDVAGVGLPTGVAALLGVLATGIVGLLLAPLASRLRTLGLAVASIGMIYVGQYVLDNATHLTGGTNGRTIPALNVLGYTFASSQSLWYLALTCLIATWLYAQNLLRSRPGRALQALRDNPLAAQAMGVNIPLEKAKVYIASGVISGVCGVMLALAFQTVQPAYFDFNLSVQYLAMTILGGLGSPTGAVAGAMIVTLVPSLVAQYGGFLPFVNTSGSLGSSGLTAQEVSQIVFGIAIIAFLRFIPGGLASIGPLLADRVQGLLERRARPSARGPAQAD